MRGTPSPPLSPGRIPSSNASRQPICCRRRHNIRTNPISIRLQPSAILKSSRLRRAFATGSDNYRHQPSIATISNAGEVPGHPLISLPSGSIFEADGKRYSSPSAILMVARGTVARQYAPVMVWLRRQNVAASKRCGTEGKPVIMRHSPFVRSSRSGSDNQERDAMICPSSASMYSPGGVGVISRSGLIAGVVSIPGMLPLFAL